MLSTSIFQRYFIFKLDIRAGGNIFKLDIRSRGNILNQTSDQGENILKFLQSKMFFLLLLFPSFFINICLFAFTFLALLMFLFMPIHEPLFSPLYHLNFNFLTGIVSLQFDLIEFDLIHLMTFFVSFFARIKVFARTPGPSLKSWNTFQNSDSYVHRVGRTARAGQIGTALSLVAAKEMDQLKEVEDRLQQVAGGEALRPYQVQNLTDSHRKVV